MSGAVTSFSRQTVVKRPDRRRESERGRERESWPWRWAEVKISAFFLLSECRLCVCGSFFLLCFSPWWYESVFYCSMRYCPTFSSFSPLCKSCSVFMAHWYFTALYRKDEWRVKVGLGFSWSNIHTGCTVSNFSSLWSVPIKHGNPTFVCSCACKVATVDKTCQYKTRTTSSGTRIHSAVSFNTRLRLVHCNKQGR